MKDKIGQNRGAPHSICNLKDSVPKNDYHLIIRELLEKTLAYLEENTEKHITFTVATEKQFTIFDENGEEFTKKYSAYYNLLIAQNLRQARYQILSIVLLEEFRELNVNIYVLIKNEKHAEINIKVARFS